MEIFINNPFRVLGIYTNASARDIVANVNKAKAFLKVGKDFTFETDFSNYLPPINRTIESLETAQAAINQTTDRLKYSFFWFIKDNSLDEIAFGHLKTGNAKKTKEILEKKESFSSHLNLGLIALFERNLRVSFKHYNALLENYSYRTNFIDSVCGGDKIKISQEELTILFYDSIMEYYSASDVIKALDDSKIEYEIVKDRAINIPIKLINTEISSAKNADKDSNVQYRVGIELINNTKELLANLKSIAGNDEVVIITVDNLAKQILQCGINYYNGSTDIDKAKKAYKIQNYALSIATSKSLKERCKENVDILLSAIEALPPSNLYREAEVIHNKLHSYSLVEKTIEKAIQLIINCGPYLATIKEEQGVSGKFYQSISTEVEEAALGTTIDIVNKALNRLNNASEFDKFIALNSIKSTLKDAWKAMAYMEVLDVEPNAKNRFEKQKQALRNLMSQVGVSTHITLTFKLETETEIFNACRTKTDYSNYVQRFPNGKYLADARCKIAEIERKEKEERQQLINAIEALTSVEEAIPLKAKCKEAHLKSKLDDKCFSLCISKADFKKYVKTFGNTANHLSEANSHLKVDIWFNNIIEKIKHNKGWAIFIAILFTVIIGVGVIWGPSGYSGLLYTLAVISGLIAYGGLSSKDGSGCLVSIIAGVICGLFVLCGNAIDDFFKEQIKINEAEKAYKNLSSNASEDDYAEFIIRYPNSPYKKDAMLRYYETAVKNGVSSLDAFANKYSSEDLGKKASSRVTQICDSLYTVAERIGTIEGWNEYRASVPVSYYADSQDRIEEIQNQSWNTEPKAWSQATYDNTLSSYQKYLDLYPNGAHHKAADKKVIDLQVANVYASEHGELPSMDKVGYGGGSTSDICIENSTQYTLTLLYSGPDSKRVVISPQQTSYVTLRNGSYRVAASVSASGVRNFAGTENLTGGSYSVEYYIVTSRY